MFGFWGFLKSANRVVKVKILDFGTSNLKEVLESFSSWLKLHKLIRIF